MPLNRDDLERLWGQASERVTKALTEATDELNLPQTERDEVAEYDAFTPEQHGALLGDRGEDGYRQYAEHVERMRVKHRLVRHTFEKGA